VHHFVTKLLVLSLICSISGSFKAVAQAQQVVSNSHLTAADNDRINRLANELEELRQLLKIPGMSAAIVKDQRLIWAKGFGFSDYENKVPATPETPYEIASVSKTFGAILLMQLVEQGKVSLDDPMSKYSDAYKTDIVKIRHVLTHTSEGTPGDHYEYNGDLFANLFDPIVKASGQRYRLLLAENILRKIGTTGTAPGNDLNDPTADHAKMAELLGAENEKKYVEVIKRVARSYKLYGADEIVPTYDVQRGLSPANGIISTVTDLAKYDIALDQNVFLKKQTQEQMWTSARTNNGQPIPYGLGWFVQEYRGLKLVWHNGNLPELYSALVLKIPEKRITFILLANSDALSAPFKLAQGNVMRSAFACAFLRSFVFEDTHKTNLPSPNWRSNEKEFAKEITRLRKESSGYEYDREIAAHSAMVEWLDQHRASARKRIKIDTKLYDVYVGQYQLVSGNVWTITSEGGRLMRQGSVLKIELFPESETEFFSKFPEGQYSFVKDGMGRVTQLKAWLAGDELLAKKIK